MEIWKKINSHPKYEASSMGRIRNAAKLNIKSQHESNRGYLNVGLRSDTTKNARLVSVHRLVAEAFFGESRLSVNHKNFDKHDNRIENLEYMTVSENIRHAKDGGKHYCRGVFQVDKAGKIINKYRTLVDANNNFKKEISKECINKTHRTANGYLWFDIGLLDDFNANPEKYKYAGKRHRGSKPVLKLDLKGTVVARYESASSAELSGDTSACAIYTSIKHGTSPYGFLWKYAS
jgi:hypothetical protein